tara:strand:+ start:680 stop:1477 length:798 start_codon:yes stop_codon:yes gene_type:complete
MIEIFDKSGRLLSAAIAILLILSTSYDYSFLLALDLSFNEVPTSISDHVRSAIIWLPQVILYFFALALYEMHMRWVEDGKSEEELINNSSNPGFIRKFRASPKYAFAVIIILSVLLKTLLSNSIYYLYVVGITAWGFTAFNVVSHKKLGANIEPALKRLVVSFPILVVLVGSMGYLNGEGLLNKTEPEWIIEIDSPKYPIPRDINGFRRFEKTAIIVDKDQQVVVIPSDWILSSKIVQDGSANRPRICRWFGVVCPDPDNSDNAL